MSITDVRCAHKKLLIARTRIEELESDLQVEVARFVVSLNGSLRSKAKQMDITVGYLGDIVNRRRKVSDEVIERLGRLK